MTLPEAKQNMIARVLELERMPLHAF